MKTTYALALSAALITGALHAVEEPSHHGPEVSVETTVASKFLWRGFVVNNSPSLQPSITSSYHGLSINVWTNFSRSVEQQHWTETDLTSEYDRGFGKFTLAGGYTAYRFAASENEGANRTSEVFAGIAYTNDWNPSFRVYKDLQAGDGYYYFGSLARAYRLPHAIKASTSVGIGLNQHLFQEQTTISNVESTTSVDLYSNERVTVAPFVTVSTGHRSLFGTHAAFGIRAVSSR